MPAAKDDKREIILWRYFNVDITRDLIADLLIYPHMPNGHGQRQEDEEQLIAGIEEHGWNHFSDPPNWIVDAAKSDGIPSVTIGFEAAQKKYHGDNYVYLAVSSVHSSHLHVFLKRNLNILKQHPKKVPVRTARSTSRDTTNMST